MVGLYEEPERPPNAVDYIKRYMGAPTGIDVDALRQENEDLKKEREELRSTIDELNTRLTQGAEEEDRPPCASPPLSLVTPVFLVSGARVDGVQ